ncbi:MAG TPA: glucan biosynthesis protein G [Rubrivivax sp.]|nr:glucan biosynthesis protein G [Rubrivivax sp.]
MFRTAIHTLLLLATLGVGSAWAFGFEDVAALARQSAARPYEAPVPRLPAALSGLSYDGLRDIRYRPDRAVWRTPGLPFELQMFHLGGNQKLAVQLHEVHEGEARPLRYQSGDWDFGAHDFSRDGFGDIGHAGFRVHTALNGGDYKDEVVAFLGASYFRALGRGQQYGLSARALALDTVGGSAGEEFPRFTSFWLQRPAPGDRTLTIDALLDSPRASGAYRFVITPGDNTVIDVQMRLYLRGGTAPLAMLAMLGIAPLTSMYQHGENQPRAGDFRPEVHDSDGLLIAGGAEWQWRPLVNPAQAVASSFEVQRLHGFGLMQRDRRFAAYEDIEAHYERRPSAWVEPLGEWGPGRVQLLMLPTPDETHDNIVAAWVPASQPAPGEPLDLAWRLHWQGEALQQPPGGWTVQSRRGRGLAAPPAGEVQYTLDFDGPALRALPPGARVEAVASTPTATARITEAHAWPHPHGGWRMLLRVQRQDPTQALELRAYLRHGTDALTETWTALIPQESP